MRTVWSSSSFNPVGRTGGHTGEKLKTWVPKTQALEIKSASFVSYHKRKQWVIRKERDQYWVA